jgi:hypothetical protein
MVNAAAREESQRELVERWCVSCSCCLLVVAGGDGKLPADAARKADQGPMPNGLVTWWWWWSSRRPQTGGAGPVPVPVPAGEPGSGRLMSLVFQQRGLASAPGMVRERDSPRCRPAAALHRNIARTVTY